jgi:PUA domain protein
MAPGITKIADDLKAGTIVVIIDETYGKSLAIGELLFDGSEIANMKKGKAIRNIHYVNDEIWTLEL